MNTMKKRLTAVIAMVVIFTAIWGIDGQEVRAAGTADAVDKVMESVRANGKLNTTNGMYSMQFTEQGVSITYSPALDSMMMSFVDFALKNDMMIYYNKTKKEYYLYYLKDQENRYLALGFSFGAYKNDTIIPFYLDDATKKYSEEVTKEANSSIKRALVAWDYCLKDIGVNMGDLGFSFSH